MKLRYLATSLVMVSLLSSCKQNELRSDIKEFVASFSLSASMSEYKHAGFSDVRESFIDGVKTVENASLEFDISSEENPTYSYQKSTVINDGEAIIYQKYIEKEENKFYLFETNKEKIEYTFGQLELLVRDFFYTKTMYDGSYHSNGMYYGDLILETARDLQQFVRIDAENSLYIYDYKTEGKVGGKDASVQSYYTVNRVGMLVKNISKQVNGDNYINQEINVFKL